MGTRRKTDRPTPRASRPPPDARAGDGGGPSPGRGSRRQGPSRRLVPLPLWVRIVLFLVGWTLLLVGVAGLVLPGIQGVLTIFAGAAILSLVSELAYEKLRALLHRWPGVWRRVEGLRLKLHRRLRRRRR